MSATEQAASRPKKHIGWWTFSILSIVVAVVLLGLPYLIKFETIKWLQTHGAGQAHIDDIDLNLFAGTFQIDSLVVQTNSETPLRIWQLGGDIKILDLLDKRATIQSLWLYGGHLSVIENEDGGLTIGGIKIPMSIPATETAPTDQSDWKFGLNTIVLANTTVEYHAPHLEQNYYLNVVYVLDMHSWEPDRPAQVGIDMRINNQPFTVSSSVRPFAAEPDTAARLDLQGLNLGDFSALASLAEVRNLSGTASFKLSLDAVQQDKEQMLLSITGDLILRDLRADYADMSLTHGLLHYSGTAKLQLHGPADVPMVNIEGLLMSKDSSFTMADLNIKHGELVWNTTTKVFNAETKNGPMIIRSQGEGNIDSLTVDDRTRGLILADVGRLAVEHVEFTSDKGITAARVDVSDLNALQRESKKKRISPAVVAVGKTTVQNISYTLAPPRLEIESIDLSKFKGNFTREADGSLYGLAQLALAKDANAKPSSRAQGADTATAKDGMPAIRLGSLKIENNAEIHWTDNMVKPTVSITVQPLSLTSGPIDTTKPTARTNVKLLTSLHKNNDISFTGYISPLDPKPNSRLDGTIKGLNLTNFSSYAAAAGYTLKSGRLDANITVKVTDGELDIQNKLVLTKLQLEGGGGEAKRDSASEATALPLNVALGYLRDNDDRIKLTVPVTGNVSNPQFNFNDVIRLATQAAAQQAAMSYLKQALQPLGTILLVGKLANKAANVMQLQAIKFKPGDASLDNTAQAYVQKIAGILNSRPGIKLTICGSATESDRTALLAQLTEQENSKTSKEQPRGGPRTETQTEISDDALLNLANRRSKDVWDLLVAGHKVNPDQLFDCRPVVDKDLAAVPSITLGI